MDFASYHWNTCGKEIRFDQNNEYFLPNQIQRENYFHIAQLEEWGWI